MQDLLTKIERQKERAQTPPNPSSSPLPSSEMQSKDHIKKVQDLLTKLELQKERAQTPPNPSSSPLPPPDPSPPSPLPPPDPSPSPPPPETQSEEYIKLVEDKLSELKRRNERAHLPDEEMDSEKDKNYFVRMLLFLFSTLGSLYKTASKWSIVSYLISDNFLKGSEIFIKLLPSFLTSNSASIVWLLLHTAGSYYETKVLCMAYNFMSNVVKYRSAELHNTEFELLTLLQSAINSDDKEKMQEYYSRKKEYDQTRLQVLKADLWARALYHNAILTVPSQLPHAIEQLYLYACNGFFRHQSSVCLWNTERVLQTLLIAHGRGIVNSEQTPISIFAPQSVIPASTVPKDDALFRMRLRVGYQLRQFVHIHFSNAMKTNNDIANDVWLKWHWATDADLLDYADNITKWENGTAKSNIFKSVLKPFNDHEDSLKLTLVHERQNVTAAAYRYRNLRYATVKFDEPTKNIQKKNIREAEILNRDTRAQFVYSVTLASALFYRTTGMLLRNVHIKDNHHYVNDEILPSLDEKEAILQDTEPPMLKETHKAQDASYAELTRNKEDVFKQLRRKPKDAKIDRTQTVKGSDDDDDDDDDDDSNDDSNDDNIMQYIRGYYNFDALWNAVQERDVSPTYSYFPKLPQRRFLIHYMTRVVDGTGFLHQTQVKQTPHLSSLALSEVCTVFSGATMNNYVLDTVQHQNT